MIDAPREKVWDTMLGDATYPQWTEPFSPGGSGSKEGSWDEGSEIHFIGPDPETGKAAGMASRVITNRKPEFLSLEHFGIIMDGVVDTTSEEAKKWTSAFENYTFVEKDGGTEVIVEVDVAEEHMEMFKDMWPKALQILKELSEK